MEVPELLSVFWYKIWAFDFQLKSGLNYLDYDVSSGGLEWFLPIIKDI